MRSHNGSLPRNHKYMTQEELASWSTMSTLERQKLNCEVRNLRMSKDNPKIAAGLKFNALIYNNKHRLKRFDILTIKGFKDPFVRLEKATSLLNKIIKSENRKKKIERTKLMKQRKPEILQQQRDRDRHLRATSPEYVEKNKQRSERFRSEAYPKFLNRDLSMSKSQMKLAVRKMKKEMKLSSQEYARLIELSEIPNKMKMFKEVNLFLESVKNNKQ